MSDPEAPALASTWTSVRGLSVHARVSTNEVAVETPAVVLVHGLGVSSRYMVPLALRLAPTWRVYAPDLPGSGRSEKPERALDVPQLADTLDEWMQAVGIERANLVANSLGCQIVADLAARRGERVERVVLVGPTVDRHARTFVRQTGRLLLDSVREPPSLWAVIALDYLVFGPLRLLRTARYALEDRVEEKLRDVPVLALVVRGERDALVSQRWAEEVARLLPEGQLAVVPGAAHAVNYNAPTELVRVLLPFFARDAVPGRAR